MSMVVVLVEYEIVAATKADFMSIVRAHARRTKTEEPGCIRFDILEPLDETGKKSTDRVLLFELFRDQDALEKHRGSPNLPGYFADIKPLIRSRRPTYADVEE